MDRPNLALVERALERDFDVTVVTHSIEAGALKSEHLEIWKAPRPMSSVVVGEIFLEQMGNLARRRYPKAVVVANGGNLVGADINWVHYVHAAEPPLDLRLPGGAYRRIRHARYARRELRSFLSAKWLVTDSFRCRADVLAHYPVDGAKVRPVYYGTDADVGSGQRLTREQSERATGLRLGLQRAMFIGGIGDRRKGLDTLLHAWSILTRAGNWPVELLVAGEGPGRREFERMALELGLSDSVQFLGFRTDIPALLGAVDLMVAPTRYEPYGLAVHEALCARIPAIVSATAGVAERYPETLRPLLLQDPESAEELAARLSSWREQVQRYQQAAADFAPMLASRSWAEMADEILALAEAL
jgi:glycosyltransferase involved in cell wall biosynthesis